MGRAGNVPPTCDAPDLGAHHAAQDRCTADEGPGAVCDGAVGRLRRIAGRGFSHRTISAEPAAGSVNARARHDANCRYRQAELMHARWAMLGVAGILAQELVVPNQFWYTSALPENLPEPFQRPEAMGGLLAFQFCMMHWVEVRRWMDYKNPGSVNEVGGCVRTMAMHCVRGCPSQPAVIWSRLCQPKVGSGSSACLLA